MEIVHCESCHAQLERHPYRIKASKRHFCNHACYSVWKSQQTGLNNPTNKLQPVNCFHCGKETLKSPWEIERRDKIFCTKECYELWRAEQSQSEYRPCAICGTPKRFGIGKLKRNELFFCSQPCRNQWRSESMKGENHHGYKGPVTFTCAYCEKRFTRERAQIKRQYKKTFCSEQCMFEYMSKIQSGENHPWWKGGRYPRFGANWDSQRKKARERDNNTCQDCGKTEAQNGKRMHVHHIIPRAEGGNNMLDNLISLCSSCHMKREHATARTQGTTLKKLGRNSSQR